MPRRNSSCAVAVLTKNEARNLPACLRGIPRDQVVVVVDSGSSDETLSIARAHGCRILSRDWTGFADQRNFTLEELKSEFEWVLFIDADEIFPTRFFEWMKGYVRSPDAADVVYVSSRLFLNGRLLRHAPGYPIYHPRLVRTHKDLFIPNGSNHGETAKSGFSAIKVDIPYAHYFTGPNLEPWLRKHIGLAAMEVGPPLVPVGDGRETARRWLNRRLSVGPLRVIARFAYHYLVCAGFLDGREGLFYSAMYAWYELTKWLMTYSSGAPQREDMAVPAPVTGNDPFIAQRAEI